MRPTLLTLILSLAAASQPAGAQQPTRTGYHAVEACFVLDTTGSMSSAIAAAREKVWFIATRIVDAPQRPDVRLCLMAFRDRGDDYVTRLSPLTDEIDVIYETLQGLDANGGGDMPEAVYQALMETVRNAGWSDDPGILRVIFLIGDAPPQHYADEPGYPQIVDEALRRGIAINPVLVGTNSQARSAWAQLDGATPGQMIDLPVVRTAQRQATPLDQDLVALDARLNATRVPYAGDTDEHEPETRPGDAELVDRLAFGAATGRVFHRRGDLVQDLDSGVMRLDSLSPESLPPALRSMNRQELVQRLGEIRAERQALTRLIERLLEQRRALISTETREGLFEKRVSELIVDQLSRTADLASAAANRTGSSTAPPPRPR